MKEIQFDANGERLSICIEIGYAQIGSYRLRVWESESNVTVLDKSGNNQNPDDDCYELPLPTSRNNGRYVQCEVGVLSPDPKPGDKYSVRLVFRQGTNILDTVEETGIMNTARIRLEFWTVLRTS